MYKKQQWKYPSIECVSNGGYLSSLLSILMKYLNFLKEFIVLTF